MEELTTKSHKVKFEDVASCVTYCAPYAAVVLFVGFLLSIVIYALKLKNEVEDVIKNDNHEKVTIEISDKYVSKGSTDTFVIKGDYKNDYTVVLRVEEELFDEVHIGDNIDCEIYFDDDDPKYACIYGKDISDEIKQRRLGYVEEKEI